LKTAEPHKADSHVQCKVCFDFPNVGVGIVIVKTEFLMSQHRNETFGIINWATSE
jgi:hypothetical protein